MVDLDTPPDYGIWKRGKVRVFISHLSAEKSFAMTVATELAAWGLHGFVAHEDIEVSNDWSEEIQKALKSAHVFVGLAHPGFTKSCWVQQEIGWTCAREIPFLIVRFGEDPQGFPAARQWKSMVGDSTTDVANHIVGWLNLRTEFSNELGDAAIGAFEKAGSYYDARDAAARVEQLGKLAPYQLEMLADAFWANDQASPGHIAKGVVQRIFAAHDMEIPPPPE